MVVIIKRTDVKIGKDVKPIVIPRAPVPIKTKIVAIANLETVEIIETIVIIFVFNEATTVERNRSESAVDPIRRIKTISEAKSTLKRTYIQSLAISIMRLERIMPTDTISKDPFTNNFVSSNFCWEKLFPRKRCRPLGTPIVITVERIAAREINAEELPIIAGVVIFDMTSQKNILRTSWWLLQYRETLPPLPISVLLTLPHYFFVFEADS
jgi:hypothetical protein